ncbi:MAG: serine/threonine-protein kinase [Acidobacteriota bacterium]|nr:serine/threonine-protein kinase [Acidobacteriota bacterium]
MKEFDRRLTEIIEEIRKESRRVLRPSETSVDDELTSLLSGFPPEKSAVPSGAPSPEESAGEEEFLSRFGRYFLLEKLGFGNMAETFKTSRMDDRDGKRRILKRIRIESPNEDLARVFLEDVKRVSRLHHDNIVAVTDYGKINDYVYLVKEYVDGMDLESLSARLRALNRRLPFPFLAYIGIRVCDALTAAGEVHGNIVPSNLLISFSGKVKLTDFSLFRTAKTLYGKIPGLLRKKIAYLSPQQARGEEIDFRADIYALGAVLYEMAGGDPVFPRDSGLSLVAKILNGQVIPVFSTDFEAPEIFKNGILKALRYDPSERHASLDHFRQELKRHLLEEAGEPWDKTETSQFLTAGFDETSPPEAESAAPVPAEVEPEPAPPPEEAGLEVLPTQHRVVIGIQNALTQRIVKMAFNREDFESEIVADGRDVLEAALRTKADAVILEIDLPNINGYDLCDVIKRSSDLKETKVVLIRKEFEKVDDRRLNLLNYDLLVQMPVKSVDLAEKTRQLLIPPV